MHNFLMNRIMKYKNITKKRGDFGETDLCIGGRVSKTDIRIKTVGKIDTFHATLGLCHEYIIDEEYRENLLSIQKDLTLLMGELCSDDTQMYFEKFGGIGDSQLGYVDQLLETTAHTLDTFNVGKRGWSYYGQGGPLAARLDFSGTICRECELQILDLQTNGYEIRQEILSYMNRLSKVLYLLARLFEFRNSIR
jgi:cob(I)alamin adenosyltransferase